MKLSADAQGLLDLRDIRDDAMFFGGGDAAAILEVTPVEYDSLSRDNKDEVIFHYMDQLNDLNHRLQILVTKGAGTNPSYYIVVPAEKSLDKKKLTASLDSRCEKMIKGLSTQDGIFLLDIHSVRLSTKKLMSLFKPYLGRGFSLKEEEEYIKADKYHRVIAAEKYPRTVDPGWLTKLLATKTPCNISMHILPYSVEESIRMLEEEINEIESEMSALTLKGKPIPASVKEKKERAEGTLRDMQENKDKMFKMSMYVDSSSDKLTGLKKATETIKSNMNDCGITSMTPSENMYPALRSTLPILRDELTVTREITTYALAATFPFVKIQ